MALPNRRSTRQIGSACVHWLWCNILLFTTVAVSCRNVYTSSWEYLLPSKLLCICFLSIPMHQVIFHTSQPLPELCQNPMLEVVWKLPQSAPRCLTVPLTHMNHLRRRRPPPSPHPCTMHIPHTVLPQALAFTWFTDPSSYTISPKDTYIHLGIS